MPTSSSSVTSQRLLRLLSLLQSRRDWPGALLSERLAVSDRTVRRDVDRLRDLGYPIAAVKGPDGGYRLEAGTRLPPLLFDDEQAVALAVALRAAVTLGAGIEEPAARALNTLRQVLPGRLRARIDAFAATAVPRPDGGRPELDPEVLVAISAAITAREELRSDYASPGVPPQDEDAPVPPRRVQPHALVARAGRWYVVGWDPSRDDWRVFRADRLTLRTPNGPRFTPRELPGGDVGAFVTARFAGSTAVPDGGGSPWPCVGEVLLERRASEVAPFLGDGTVEVVAPERCRVRLGSWSWTGLAASLARFDAELEVIGPPDLRAAFATLAARAQRAAG